MVRTVGLCGKRHKAVECPSSVPSIDSSGGRRVCCLDRARSTYTEAKAAATVRHAGLVNFGLTVRSNMLVPEQPADAFNSYTR